MSIPSPIIKCGSIELRLLTIHDADQLFSLAHDPIVSKYLQWSAHTSVDDSLDFIHTAQKLWDSGTAWLPGIFDDERKQLIGCTGIHDVNRSRRCAEIGSWIGVPFQGLGYNFESKAAIITFAFQCLDLTRVEFLTRTENQQSITAMRKLPKIREEGVLTRRIYQDGENYDALLFTLLKDDFDEALWPKVEVLVP